MSRLSASPLSLVSVLGTASVVTIGGILGLLTVFLVCPCALGVLLLCIVALVLRGVGVHSPSVPAPVLATLDPTLVHMILQVYVYPRLSVSHQRDRQVLVQSLLPVLHAILVSASDQPILRPIAEVAFQRAQHTFAQYMGSSLC